MKTGGKSPYFSPVGGANEAAHILSLMGGRAAIQGRKPNGQLGAIEYTILEQPRPPEPKPEKPERENPAQLNTNRSSKEKSKKIYQVRKDQILSNQSPQPPGLGPDAGARELSMAWRRVHANSMSAVSAVQPKEDTRSFPSVLSRLQI